MATRGKRRAPTHPGQVLKNVFDEAGMSANAVALALRIPANRLTEIINGQSRSREIRRCAWRDILGRRRRCG